VAGYDSEEYRRMLRQVSERLRRDQDALNAMLRRATAIDPSVFDQFGEVLAGASLSAAMPSREQVEAALAGLSRSYEVDPESWEPVRQALAESVETARRGFLRPEIQEALRAGLRIDDVTLRLMRQSAAEAGVAEPEPREQSDAARIVGLYRQLPALKRAELKFEVAGAVKEIGQYVVALYNDEGTAQAGVATLWVWLALLFLYVGVKGAIDVLEEQAARERAGEDEG
jgi:hypothetical protein